MANSFALLADPTAKGRRTSVLKYNDEAITVRGTVMHSDDSQLLLVRAWLFDRYAYVALDDCASVLATATGETHDSTYGRIRDELDRKRVPLRPREEEYGLLADHVDGQRRTSVLKSDDRSWSMRVKVIETDEDTYLQLRIELYEVGFAHLMLHESGAIVALVTGATDSDAWGRLQGELRRRGVELD